MNIPAFKSKIAYRSLRSNVIDRTKTFSSSTKSNSQVNQGTQTQSKLHISLQLIALILIVFSAQKLSAQYWNGPDGNWFEDGNWLGGVPDSSSAAVILNGTAHINGGIAETNLLGIGLSGGGGTVSVESGILNVYGDVTIGAAATGTLNISGGAVHTMGYQTIIGASVTGYVSVTDAQWINDGMIIFSGGQHGELNINAGGEVITDSILYNGYNSGLLTLNGVVGDRGILTTNEIKNDTTNSQFLWNGGILRASSDSSDFFINFIPGSVTLNSGGGFFDNNGFHVTITTDLGGVGKLTKMGAGTLVLTGNNTFQGGVTIEKGTLQITDHTQLGDHVSLSFAALLPTVTGFGGPNTPIDNVRDAINTNSDVQEAVALYDAAIATAIADGSLPRLLVTGDAIVDMAQGDSTLQMLGSLSGAIHVSETGSMTFRNFDESRVIYSQDGILDLRGGNQTSPNLIFSGNHVDLKSSTYASPQFEAPVIVKILGILNIENAIFSDNKITMEVEAGNESMSAHGGAIHIYQGVTLLNNVIFSSNQSEVKVHGTGIALATGGAVRNYQSSFYMSGGSFQDNTATAQSDGLNGVAAAYGGAIHNQDGTMIFDDVSFQGNKAETISTMGESYAYGGAIRGGSGTLHLINTSFENNGTNITASGQNTILTAEGGALHGYGAMYLSQVQFEANNSVISALNGLSSAAVSGGAIYSTSLLHINGAQFNLNSAQGFTNSSNGNSTVRGGAIYSTGFLQITGADFIENSAMTTASGGIHISSSGGAIYVNSTTNSYAITSLFRGNVAYSYNTSNNAYARSAGGAIYNESSFQITDTIFLANLAHAEHTLDSAFAIARGAAIYNKGFLDITNGKFLSNLTMANYYFNLPDGTAQGGAIYTEGVLNLYTESGKTTLFSGNRANSVSNSIHLADGSKLNIYTEAGGLLDMRDPISRDNTNTKIIITHAGEGVWALGGDNHFVGTDTAIDMQKGTLYLYGAGEAENNVVDGSGDVVEAIMVENGQIRLDGPSSIFVMGSSATLVVGGENVIHSGGYILFNDGATILGGSDPNTPPGVAHVTKLEMLSGYSRVDLLGKVNFGAVREQDHLILDANFGGFGGGIQKIGAGTVELLNASYYSGGTDIMEGTLLVSNTLGSATGDGDVNVFASGKLAGTGFVSGKVFVNDYGTISPGATPGTLTVGELHLSSLANMDFELYQTGIKGGLTNDFIKVNGNLTLNGSINLLHIGSLGLYHLIDYTGTLDQQGVYLSAAPGINPGNFSLDLSTPGEVNLIYQNNGNIQYWDGDDAPSNQIVGGGSGIWSVNSPTWTNSSGDLNGTWGGQIAVFGNRPGLVTLGSDVWIEDLIFNVGGYQIVSQNGYRIISPGDLEIFTAGGVTAIRAPLWIQGEFVKSGFGTLSLYGQTIVREGTLVKSGRLNVFGLLRSPYVNVFGGAHLNVNGVIDGNVHNSGLLTGNGLITGNLWNGGVVAPGNSIGTLTIGRNFTQSRHGVLQIEAASTRDHDLLIVGGTARLGGTLEFLPISAYRPKYGDQIPFLLADKIVGEFDRITVPNPSRNRGRFVNYGKVGTLLIAPTSYTLVANNPQEHQLARVLDRWIGIETGDIGEVTLALDLQSEEQYAQSFAAISPAYIGGAVSTSLELSHSQQQQLHQQLHARRLADRIPNVPAMPESPASSGGKSVKGSKSVSPQMLEPTEEDLRWSAWTHGSGLFSSGGLSLNPGEDFESGTIMVGADYLLNEALAVGLFASYQEGWGDYDHGGDIDLEAVRFGAYLTYDNGGIYANAIIGAGQVDYDIQRPIRWAYLDRNASSNPEAIEFFTSVSGGYDLKHGNWTFGPQISLQYSKLSVDEFKERGAGVLNLRMDEFDSDSLRSYLGGRLAYTYLVNPRFAIIPEIRAFWQHEFLDGDSARAVLDGGNGPAFTHTFSDPDEDSLYIGAGIGFQMGPRVYANIYYNLDLGRNDDESHTFSISGTVRF